MTLDRKCYSNVIGDQPLIGFSQKKAIKFAVLIISLYIAFIPRIALAQNCNSPSNLILNPTFENSLDDYTATGNWVFNQSLDPAVYGTVYNTRTAVVNGTAAPSGNEATSYPAATLDEFTINENDAADDKLVPGQTSGDFSSFSNTALHVYFDMGWRQAGGTQSFVATLDILVDGVTYMTITTFDGTAAGNATGQLFNGATLGAGSGLNFYNNGGPGTISEWNTIPLIVPFTGTAMPEIEFVMSGSNGVSDDFNIDRIYVPVCSYGPLTAIKSHQTISDSTNGSSNAYDVPGATVRYCIIINNPAGSANKTSVTISDDLSSLPISFIANSIRSEGTTTGNFCNDDGVTSGSFSNDVVSVTFSTFPEGETKTLYFDAILD